MRAAIPAMLLTCLGVQAVMTSFFVALLDQPRRLKLQETARSLHGFERMDIHRMLPAQIVQPELVAVMRQDSDLANRLLVAFDLRGPESSM